ncbi:MAG TPA: tetratricopeptide repeat protein [Gemmataceae bacterium]|nr:tetratricopeptide repeat protein [Gemmataceae bacterium]
MPDSQEVISIAPVAEPDWPDAIRYLEQAVKAGNQDPHALYLLAMAYKHQNRSADARQTLAKIADPDANVLLQRGVLAFNEKEWPAAATEFEKATQKDPASYAAAYNLMLTRLCQGQLEGAVEMLDKLLPLAPTPQENRFLAMLRGLLGGTDQSQSLASISPQEEQRLLDMIVGLNQFEVVYRLLAKLVSARPSSEAAFRAYIGAALVQAKLLVERCQWSDAEILLAPLKRRLESSQIKVDPFYLIAILNMLGVCAAMTQDFERGLNHFRAAADAFQRDFSSPGPASKTDRYVNAQGVYLGAWLEQNLAIANEALNRFDLAETHWNRYFDYLEHYVPRSLPPDYLPNLGFEGASRLADQFSRKEKWGSAAHFLQRAHRIRPTDYETLERLFHMYTQLKRNDEARKILRRLREVRPNDPQGELFELEVREVRRLDDVDALLSDLRRVAQRFPNDSRVEERGSVIVHNVMPILERIADQYAGQVNKVVDQMRRLPSYQINWPTVRDIMRDMEDKYLFLRRVAQKCLAHVTSDEVRRELHRLISHCDRKIDQCHSLGE